MRDGEQVLRTGMERGKGERTGRMVQSVWQFSSVLSDKHYVFQSILEDKSLNNLVCKIITFLKCQMFQVTLLLQKIRTKSKVIIYMYVSMYVCIYVSIDKCVSVYVYVCIHVYMHYVCL